ncbi:hypothetical protein Q7535_14305, partial [Glaesserella parasuis]|nr:hypothetical protein [Glaesserella parasuis]
LCEPRRLSRAFFLCSRAVSHKIELDVVRKNVVLTVEKSVANVDFGGLLAADLQHKGGYQLFPPPLSLRQLPPQAGGAKALGKIS